MRGQDALGELASCALYTPSTNTWTAAGNLSRASSHHTTTLLASGQVLLAGGFQGTTTHATSEVYTAFEDLGSWSTTGSMAQIHTTHTASLLQSGKVLVAGGLASSTTRTATAELYDPATNSWASTGSLVGARSSHTATVLADGRVLVTGGGTTTSELTQCDVYNPATNSWTSTGSLLTPRENHTATLLPTGEVLVTGGNNSTTGELAQAELYNPATGTWSSAGTMAIARTNHTATLLPTGHVLIVGGAYNLDAEIYNPYTGQWTLGGVLPSGAGILGHTTTLLPEGDVLLAGGSNTSSSRTATARLYTPNDALVDWYPFISSVSPGNAVPAGTAITLSGLRFRGVSEAGGGSALSSATDVPLVTLRSLQDESVRFLTPSTFSGTSLTVTLPSGLTGPYLLFLTTNAITTGQMLLLGSSTAPDTTLTATPPAQTNSRSASFSFTSPTSTATFECSLDGGAFTTCASPRAYTSLADGFHTLAVRAKDGLGSVDSTPASHVWMVDATPPQTTLTTSPASPTNSTSATFSFTADDAQATFECSLDGAAFSPCTSPTSYTGLSSGSHTFQVRARDVLTNVDASPTSYTWTVDTSAPDTLLSATPPLSTQDKTASFSFSSNEAGVTFECSLDGAAFTACASPVNYSALGAGSHIFVVRAKDGSGQRDASPPSHLWSIDATAPDTTLSSVPPALSSSPTASFTFASPESGVTFECSLDGVAFSACTAPTSYASLLEGAHTFQVRARDGAGNVDISPASHAWTVDTVAPGTPVLVAPARGATVTTAFPEFSGTAEPGSTVSVSIDGGAVGTAQADSAGNWLLTPPAPLSEGQHGISLSAKDKAGNTSPAANSTFTVKTTPDTEQPEQPGGCGCSATAPLAAWPWAVLVFGLALSRRRRR